MKHLKKSFYLLFLFILISNLSLAQKDKKTPSKYDIQGPYCSGLAKVKSKGKWGYINKAGNEVVKPKYIQVENFDGGIARVRGQKGWGLIDTTGTVILMTEFNYISEFVDGKATVRMISGEETQVNRKGQKIGK